MLTSKDISLLHIVCDPQHNINGCNNLIILKIIKDYHANIKIKDKYGRSPLALVISHPFNLEEVMQLIELGHANTSRFFKTQGAFIGECYVPAEPLLHLLSNHKNNQKGRNNAAIKDLVQKYR